MEFEHAAIALLASMVLVLAGMVGWLYWQQTRMFQNMNNIVMMIGELASRPEPEPQPEPEVQPEPDTATDPEAEEEDDRVSVDEEKPETDVVDGPPGLDTDGLESKTTKELKDILTKRGIPFGKRDSKGTLISLLKATS
jgi:hypothetical protein